MRSTRIAGVDRGRASAFAAVAVAACLLLTGCTAGGPAVDGDAARTPSGASADVGDEALRDELLQMLADDQAERSGESTAFNDLERTERLKEIVGEIGGWPTISLVGEDAEDAAWAIAQHSDHDLEFQREALALLRAAVEADDASPGNLAYLEDRVAVNAGEDQVYGTQVGCGDDGPAPATPIRDPESVDERRAQAGLPPLADYLAEMSQICADVATG